MSNKAFKPVEVPPRLAAVADPLPTQHIQPTLTAPAGRAAQGEPVVSVSVNMRRSLRDQMRRLALDRGMTIQALIMHALGEQGLTVTEDDVIDRRRKK